MMNDLEARLRAALHDPVRSGEAPTLDEVAPNTDRLTSTTGTRRSARRPLARMAAVAVVVLLIVVGVRTVVTGQDEDTNGTVEPAGDPSQRDAAIYAAALAAYIADAYPTLQRPVRAYVVDRASDRAGFTFGAEQNEEIPVEVQETVTAALADRTEVRWISDVDDVLVQGGPDASICHQVRDADLVATLDLLAADGDRDEVTVAANAYDLFASGLGDCASYSLRTYVVEERSAGWQVTGIAAPVGGVA